MAVTLSSFLSSLLIAAIYLLLVGFSIYSERSMTNQAANLLGQLGDSAGGKQLQDISKPRRILWLIIAGFVLVVVFVFLGFIPPFSY